MAVVVGHDDVIALQKRGKTVELADFVTAVAQEQHSPSGTQRIFDGLSVLGAEHVTVDDGHADVLQVLVQRMHGDVVRRDWQARPMVQPPRQTTSSRADFNDAVKLVFIEKLVEKRERVGVLLRAHVKARAVENVNTVDGHTSTFLEQIKLFSGVTSSERPIRGPHRAFVQQTRATNTPTRREQ